MQNKNLYKPQKAVLTADRFLGRCPRGACRGGGSITRLPPWRDTLIYFSSRTVPSCLAKDSLSVYRVRRASARGRGGVHEKLRIAAQGVLNHGPHLLRRQAAAGVPDQGAVRVEHPKEETPTALWAEPSFQGALN